MTSILTHNQSPPTHKLQYNKIYTNLQLSVCLIEFAERGKEQKNSKTIGEHTHSGCVTLQRLSEHGI